MSNKPKNSPLFESMFGKGKEPSRIVSWDVAEPNLLARLVVAVNDFGCAVLFGATRDRGAWALTFMGDVLPNKRQTDYQNDPEELNTWLLWWVENWEGLVEETKATRSSQKG